MAIENATLSGSRLAVEGPPHSWSRGREGGDEGHGRGAFGPRLRRAGQTPVAPMAPEHLVGVADRGDDAAAAAVNSLL